MDLNKQAVSDLAAKLGTHSEVITQYLGGESTPEVKTFSDSLPNLEVFTTDEFNTRLENERNQALQGQEGRIKGSVLGDVDKTVKADTGVDRQDNESTQDYIKRAYGEKIHSAGGKTDQQVQALRDQLTAKEQALQTALAANDQLKTDYEERLTRNTVENDLSQAAASIPIKVDKDDLLPAQQGFLKYTFNQLYEVKPVDGQRVVYDRATNQPVKDPRTASFKSINDVMRDMAPKYVTLKQDSAKPQGSGFANEPIKPTGNTGQHGGYQVDYSQYETAEALKTHMQASGISLISEQGTAMLSEYLEREQKAAATS